MLWMLLALAIPSEASTSVSIASIAELDKACASATESPKTITLALSAKHLSLGSQAGQQMAVRTALAAMNGQVMVHRVDRKDLYWEGKIDRKAVVEAYEKGEAVAVLSGRIENAAPDGFPNCFGHAQIDSRSVAMQVNEVIVLDMKGTRLGRLAPRQPEPPLPSGGVARTSATCGRPCSYSDKALQKFVERVETEVIKCTRDTTVGSMVLEVVVRPRARGIPSIRSEIASLNDRVRACVRTAIGQGRFNEPTRTSEITIVVDVPDVNTREI